jgi:hypothetical protein
MKVYEKPTAILASLLGFEAFRELLRRLRDAFLHMPGEGRRRTSGVCVPRPGEDIDTALGARVYSAYVVHAEWRGPSPLGRQSPIGRARLSGSWLLWTVVPPCCVPRYASCLLRPCGRPCCPQRWAHHLKLMPCGYQSSPSLFHVFIVLMCQSHAISLRPDTLRRCCSAASWRIASLSPGRETSVRSPGWAERRAQPPTSCA